MTIKLNFDENINYTNKQKKSNDLNHDESLDLQDEETFKLSKDLRSKFARL